MKLKPGLLQLSVVVMTCSLVVACNPFYQKTRSDCNHPTAQQSDNCDPRPSGGSTIYRPSGGSRINRPSQKAKPSSPSKGSRGGFGSFGRSSGGGRGGS